MSILQQLRTARQLLIDMNLQDSQRFRDIEKLILQTIDNLLTEL